MILSSTYVYAVLTASGQAHENAALRGADQLSTDDAAAASSALGGITVGSLLVAVCLVAVVGLLRRNVDLVVAAVGVILAGQVVTQSLKRFVLPRPELVEATGNYTHNSFPSGHTTIAMTVLFAMLLVVRFRWRGVTMLFVLPWATSIGAYTINAKWHRLSDVIGAGAVLILVACVASWWLDRRERFKEYDGVSYHGRMVLFWIVAATSALFVAPGFILWFVPMFRGVVFTVPDTTDDHTAFLGANVLGAGVSGIFALWFWALWHGLEIRPVSRR